MQFLDIILNILSSGLPCVLLALGIFLTYRLLDFADLTAEGSFLIGAAVTIVMIYNGVNPWLATLCAFISGGLCGFVTGVLNRYLKIPKLLSGIITLTASASIAMLIMGAAKGNPTFFSSQLTLEELTKGGTTQTIYSMFWPWQFSDITQTFIVVKPWGDVIKVAVMFVVVFAVLAGVYYFFGTELGMAIRATGMNEKMAKSQGINTNFSTILCVSISNAIIGLGGALYAQEAKSVSTASATGYLVVGLASILIGEAIFGKRSFKNWLISVSLGSIVYFIIVTAATRLGLPAQLKSLLYALLITFALCLPLIKKGIMHLFKSSKKEAEAK